jgi:hypothetical protein
MNNIKNALTRKLGPLPAWAWAAIAGLGLWWYRNHTAGAAASAGQAADTSYYGPYGENAYPIDASGGDSVGSGGGGDAGTTPNSPAPPVINVTPPNAGTAPATSAANTAAWNKAFNQRWLAAHPNIAARRKAKAKAKHTTTAAAKNKRAQTAKTKGKKSTARSPAAVHTNANRGTSTTHRDVRARTTSRRRTRR